jgi:putative transcriptional regulator
MVRMKLDILLTKYRLSQRELALRTGIRFETINKYTNNSYKYISNNHINILCKFFKCQVSDLLEYVESFD